MYGTCHFMWSNIFNFFQISSHFFLSVLFRSSSSSIDKQNSKANAFLVQHLIQWNTSQWFLPLEPQSIKTKNKEQISSSEHTNKKIQSDGVNVFWFSQHRLFHTWNFHHILPDYEAISTIQWKHFISFYYFFLYSFFHWSYSKIENFFS